MFGDQWIIEGAKLRYEPVWCMYVSTAIYVVCKSNVSVNHLQLYVKKVYTYTYPVAMYIYFYTLTFTQGQCKYLSNTLTQSCVNVLEHASVSGNTKIICEVTLSFGLLSPQILLSGVSIK